MTGQLQVLLALRTFNREVAQETLNGYKSRVRYLNPAKDFHDNPVVVEDDSCVETVLRRSLIDPATLEHFSCTRAVLFTCCGTLCNIDYYFDQWSSVRSRNMQYPFACIECGHINDGPMNHIRRVQQNVLKTSVNKVTYAVCDGKLNFYA